MCIICVKKKGVEMPSSKTIKNCFTANDDGAGIAYVKKGSKDVHIVKGFFKVEELEKAIVAYKLGAGDSVMLHFRQATHGLTDAGNCHPFPISNNLEKLRETNISVSIAVSHNGIFGNMEKSERFSDTQKFIAGILADKNIISGLENPSVQELLRGYCGSSSKLAFLTVKGFVLIGSWIKHKGVLYSNEGFKSPPVWGYYGGKDWRKEYEREINGYKMICDFCNSVSDAKYNEEADCFVCKNCEEYLEQAGEIAGMGE